ncbi:hypothetical protein [Nocardiopsis rhodophaea]|uniref:hypothetical protein n=1 Tax=Nocardiopsis rhodophaea TaxID=280238 RepID=UPI0031D9D9DD
MSVGRCVAAAPSCDREGAGATRWDPTVPVRALRRGGVPRALLGGVLRHRPPPAAIAA